MLCRIICQLMISIIPSYILTVFTGKINFVMCMVQKKGMQDIKILGVLLFLLRDYG